MPLLVIEPPAVIATLPVLAMVPELTMLLTALRVKLASVDVMLAPALLQMLAALTVAEVTAVSDENTLKVPLLVKLPVKLSVCKSAAFCEARTPSGITKLPMPLAA